MINREAVLAQLVPFRLHLNVRYEYLGFYNEIFDSGDWLDCRFNLCRDLAQLVEIGAEHFDGHLGLDAREHVTEKMRQWLVDTDRHAWKGFLESFPNVRDHLFTAALRLRIEGNNDLGRIDAFRMFVTRGTAGTAYGGANAFDFADNFFHLLPESTGLI